MQETADVNEILVAPATAWGYCMLIFPDDSVRLSARMAARMTATLAEVMARRTIRPLSSRLDATHHAQESQCA
jgi:hypothetical protein